MNGICLLVTHPDFVENDDGQRAAFLDGLRGGWSRVQEAQGIELTFVGVEDAELSAVAVYFGYGENGVGIRRAEEAVAATMATISLYVAQHNHSGASGVIPAYGFAIDRDVVMPDADDLTSDR